MILHNIEIYFNSHDKRSFYNIVEMTHVNQHQFKMVDWENRMYLINFDNVNFIVDLGSVMK